MQYVTRSERQFTPSRFYRALALSTIAGSLAACGGSDNSNSSTATQPPQFLANAQTCGALTGKVIPATAIGESSSGAVVTSATYKTAVADAPNSANNAIVQGTPDYCEVLVTISPVDPAAPVIKSQVNLPTNWNNKKLQFGGSGYNGVLQTGLTASRVAGPEVPLPITQGYMTTGTDSGHQVPTGGDLFTFALNEEALKNFAYAAYKKTHDVAVEVGQLYYGKKPTKSYFMGGSEGGREGMLMAQRYPADYDGIVAVDPVMNFSGLQTFGNYLGGILQSQPAGWLNGKTQLLHDTVVAACDGLDGITDGVVSNYKGCKAAADTALAAKVCPSGTDEGATCFSTAQLAVINAAHNGYTFNFPLANGMTTYAGYGFGGEGLAGNWDRWKVGTTTPTAGPDATGVSQLYTYGSGYVRYFIAKDRNFNPITYNPDNFKARVLEVSNLMDATNPDLTAFFNRGGKLILRENMADNAQSAFTGLNYWDAVVAKMGKQTVDQFFAAYAQPGLPHTSTGITAGTANAPSYGIPGRVDLLAQLENWVEKGVKPADALVTTNRQALPPYNVVASKPMCRYPLYPKYVGASPAGGNLAENYTCVAN